MSATPVLSARVRVPASSANLGPGFDCLGLALDLWNETTFTIRGEGLQLSGSGEGCGIPLDGRNMLLQGMRVLCEARGARLPRGLTITVRNDIPVGSGLGSSAAAALTGLMGMAAILGQPLETGEALELSARMEGHADNAAAALLGGLVIVSADKKGWLVRRIELPPLAVAVALPAVRLPTRSARAALPRQVALGDASFNLSRTALVIEALRGGDFELLQQAMDDRMHIPYRLPLIPGGKHAMKAAYTAGASAVTISGAGPSLIAFPSAGNNSTEEAAKLAQAMTAAFEGQGIAARGFALHASPVGAQVEPLTQAAV